MVICAAGLGAIREGDLDVGGIGHHVQAGQDIAGIVDDHPAAQAVFGLAVRPRRFGLDQDQRRPDDLVHLLRKRRGGRG